MKRFAELYAELDASTSTQAKVAAMRAYFAHAPHADAAWAAYFLAGGKPRQVLPTALLRTLACREATVDTWLFEECYQAVGDLAETIALVLPPPTEGDDEAGLAVWVEERLLPLRGLAPEEQAQRVAALWRALDARGRFLFVKLVGGGLRVGVSKLLVQRALAEVAGLDAKRVAERMMGYTDGKATPSAARFAALIAPEGNAALSNAASSQPYPFFLAHALDGDAATFAERLGPPSDWLVEWKYDGIRAQLVKRGGAVWLWSRGEELVTERYPEVVRAAQTLPAGTVLDGELLVWQPQGDWGERPAPFALLQQRIGRKTLGAKLLAATPVVFMAYDLLESDAVDRRGEPQHARRARLEALLAGAPLLKLSPLIDGADWPALAAERATSRRRGVEGFMLKRRDSAYGAGRTKSEGLWWKWKVEPMTADGVLVYAQRGHGRRASVYTDYTFAVWNRAPRDADEARAAIDAIARREAAAPDALQLVPFAKAYSGLTDTEFAQVDKAIRATTLDKFGPVRSVVPSLVFELGFEGIQASSRHKSGIAVRFPRMLRVRHDKPLHEADTLDALRALIDAA